MDSVKRINAEKQYNALAHYGIANKSPSEASCDASEQEAMRREE